MKKWVIVCAAAVVALSGCASNDAPEPTADLQPETQAVTVVIDDQGDVNAYFSLGGRTCYSAPIGGPPSPPEVLVADGSGTVLATVEGPEQADTNSSVGCQVSVTLDDVPITDIYVVTVNLQDGTSVEETESGDNTYITVNV